MIIGFVAFCLSAFAFEKHRIGWIALLHNLYFFTGLSAAGLLIAAINQACRANWGRPVKRFAEACGAFLPFSLVGLVVLYFGAEHIYEWINYPPDAELYPSKHMWLTKNFVFARDFIALTLLLLIGRRFMNASSRADMGVAHEHHPDLWTQPAGWLGAEAEIEKSQNTQSRFGVLYCIIYAIVISALAYDLIMSLDFRWISTMFGGWNFTTFMLLSWSSMMVITHFLSRRFGLEHYMSKQLYHDLGKLTFGFTVVWGYLFFAQLMVIWYGNLPHETGFIITRVKTETWQAYSWTVFAMVFLLPFILGLGKQRKMSPYTFAPVIILSICGIWLERFLLIAPSCWYFDRHQGVFEGGIGMLLFVDVLVFLGFFGAFALVFTNYLYKRPLMVIADPRLDLGINRH